eukprot:1896523-Rhodomonas_salina.1
MPRNQTRTRVQVQFAETVSNIQAVMFVLLESEKAMVHRSYQLSSDRFMASIAEQTETRGCRGRGGPAMKAAELEAPSSSSSHAALYQTRDPSFSQQPSLAPLPERAQASLHRLERMEAACT